MLYYLCVHSYIVLLKSNIYHSSWLQNSEVTAVIFIVTVNITSRYVWYLYGHIC